MRIITNNHPRELICVHDLTEDEYKEFADYVPKDGEYHGSVRFFRYKGNVYDTENCEPIYPSLSDFIQDFKVWDGIFTETFFSGVLFKYAPGTDLEEVIVGRYYA